jgi:hypothetical protein
MRDSHACIALGTFDEAFCLSRRPGPARAFGLGSAKSSSSLEGIVRAIKQTGEWES